MTPETHSALSFQQTLLAENAGVLWLAAEWFILWAMVRARAWADPAPAARDALHRLARRVAWAAAAVTLAAAAVNLRHLLLPPPHWLWAEAAGLAPAEAAAAIERAAGAFHAARRGVWYAFVTGWVLLEPAIVYQGWRLYRSLYFLDAPPKAAP